MVPGVAFESLSFPIWVPRPSVKRVAARHFHACRCGGQTFNADVLDVNLLRAFFIEKSRDDVDAIRRVIDAACGARGWLIFATHDVDLQPTPFGCTPRTFAAIVDHAMACGARVLPVAKALAEITAPA